MTSPLARCVGVSWLCGLGLLAAGAASVVASPESLIQTTTSALTHPALVELFTSEGCSSCPPADRLLAEFVQQSPVDGVGVIALSEHVDYWDGLGWRDPFSSTQFTERQNRYAARFGPDKTYTPQMIVNGTSEFVGSDRRAAVDALKKVLARTSADVRLSWTSGTTPRQLAIGVAGGASSEVWLAVTEDGLTSDVRRGENAGRKLPHTGVARLMKKIGGTNAAGAFSDTVTIAIERGWSEPALRAVVFVQAARQGVISGAQSLRFRTAEPLPLFRR